MSEFKQAERLPLDGEIGVARQGVDHFVLHVENGGVREQMTVSKFNAARVFGALALFLEIPLPPKVKKAIKF